MREAIAIDKNFYEAYLRKGGLFNALGSEDSVYSNFKQYARKAPQPAMSVIERLAHMSFDRGSYTEAKGYLDQFLLGVPEKVGDREIILLGQSLDFAMREASKSSLQQIEELPPEINQFGLQYLPTMTVDAKTIVYTKRDQYSDDEDIVISEWDGNSWSSARSISDNINTELNEGAATISADGRTMIFTACDRRDSKGSCDLYISRKVGDRWSFPKNLGNRVNSKYWESQPSLSADGRTLYFASNRPGGYGGRDLWVSTSKKSNWSTPRNLGRSVNSFKDETTPFIHFNGQTLYFSSNSYPGFGGFDLLYSNSWDSIWSKPINLGASVNTYRDEVSFLVSADGRKGYFSKEIQKNQKILDSRIVSFTIAESNQPKASYYLAGTITDQETGEPLGAGLEIVDLLTNQVFYKNYADSINGSYCLVLPEGREVAAYIKRSGYLYKSIPFRTDLNSAINVDTMNISLTPLAEGESLILNNLYFETNSHELNDRSRSEIINLSELMKSTPGLIIQIEGHTDDVGNAKYNMTLSQKRANAVLNALIEKKIDQTRLKSVGFGDTKPRSSNTSEKSRQSNRRIEFRVLRAEG
ncbi:MAG: OmpA family protein [Bacteroidota bacterium]